MFIQAKAGELAEHLPQFTVIHAPNFHAIPDIDGTHSEVFIVLNFAERVVLIGGTQYAGEIKKSIFTVMNYLLPLRDVMHGAKMRIALNAEDGCANCGGTGLIAREERRGKRVVRGAEPCPVCGGRGTIPARRSLEVTIPAGVVDGTRLRLKGQGGKGQRPELNGDLFLTVRLKPDRVFSVSGRDVRCELPVWDYEAALGAEITVPALDGRFSLKIPPGSQTGRVMRLRGRGLPARGKEAAGDLLYELKVLAPTEMTDEERRLMQEFAERRKRRAVPDPRADLMRE
jgi:DnaJ-class molecular chaperone